MYAIVTATASHTTTSEGKLCCHILAGEEAFGFLEQEHVRAQWEQLYHACPWSTVFQSHGYVLTWYKIYSSKYKPVLVVGMAANKLTGVLALAVDGSGTITGAGADQAEYQVWLALPAEETRFILSALSKVAEQFPRAPISLKYVPGKASLSWVQQHPYFKKRCFIRQVRQPLMTIEAAYFENELRKKNRREKVNRLKRLGQLNFEKLTTIEEFSSVIDVLALHYDFRKAAMYNRCFFQTDQLRKTFLLSLFEQGLLHATILRVKDTIIASNVGLMGRRWVHLQGLNTHDPFYAKHSPGILHFLFLGKLLAEEGIEVFDLTPGEDGYKHSLATDYTAAFELSIVSPRKKWWKSAVYKTKQKIKHVAAAKGVKIQAVKALKKELTILGAKLSLAPFRYLARKVLQKEALLILRKAACNHERSKHLNLSYCHVADLMRFAPEGRRAALRWEFLEDALKRLESGERCFTWCEGELLLACAWLHGPKTILPGPVTEVDQVVQGLYVHAAAGSRRKEFLESLSHWVAEKEGRRDLYLSCSPLDKTLLGDIQKQHCNECRSRG